MLTKHSFPKKLIVTLVTISLLSSSLVIYKSLKVKYTDYISNLPLAKKQLVLESNFLDFDVNQIGIASRSSRIVSSVYELNSAEEIIFTSVRTDSYISSFLYSKKSAKQIQKLDLREIQLLGMAEDYKFFVFDLLIEKNELLISFVGEPQNLKDCDVFKIISVPLLGSFLQPKLARSIWTSDSCIKSFPEDPSWHDFQGRLAANSKYVYMTAGLLVASTYQGFYPNGSLRNLSSTLNGELDKDKLFGGLIRIDRVTGQSKQISKGFRGPSGITLRAKDGSDEIWVVDHGPRGGDELNLISEGKDYGWPNVSYGTKYFSRIPGQSGYIDTKFGTHEGYQEPVYYWTPSIAPSQITILPEDFDNSSTWKQGDLILSSLKAESIFHIKLDRNLNVVSVEPIFIGARIRDITILKQTLFLTTDDGRLITLVQSDLKISEGAFPPFIVVHTPFYHRVPGVKNLSRFLDSITSSILSLFS